MDADFAIADLLSLGYYRCEDPQSYVFLPVNPIINKMLAALHMPIQLEISDKAYDALGCATGSMRVRDSAELEVLKIMRQPNVAKITITQTNDHEVLLETEENIERNETVQKKQVPLERNEKDLATWAPQRVVKKVTKEKIGIVAVVLKE